MNKIKLAEIYKKCPNTKITYIPDIFNTNNGLGIFIIGEPKDPKEPLWRK